jgi:hypothetical protein
MCPRIQFKTVFYACLSDALGILRAFLFDEEGRFMKNKKTLTWVLGLIVAALLMFGLYKAFGPKPQAGSKSVTVEVVDDQGETKTYSEKTDAEFLSELMDEMKKDGDFTYEGSTSEYGLYIISINGLTPDYEKDGAYWSIYVNGEYGQYGADAQPVADGDTYRFAYEVYVPEE